MPRYPQVGDVLKTGSKPPVVVVNVNDCRAACAELHGRDWENPDTVIGNNEHTVGISPQSEIDGHFFRVLGKFQGKIENRILGNGVDRDYRKKEEFVMVPLPGNNPKKKRRSAPISTSISDDGIAPITGVDVISLMKRSQEKLNAIVNGQSSALAGPGE